MKAEENMTLNMRREGTTTICNHLGQEQIMGRGYQHESYWNIIHKSKLSA